MELTPLQSRVLKAVAELQASGVAPSTKGVSAHLREAARESGFQMEANPPWFGLFELAHELEEAELLQVDRGKASPKSEHSPASTPNEFWLRLTMRGQRMLEDEDRP